MERSAAKKRIEKTVTAGASFEEQYRPHRIDDSELSLQIQLGYLEYLHGPVNNRLQNLEDYTDLVSIQSLALKAGLNSHLSLSYPEEVVDVLRNYRDSNPNAFKFTATNILGKIVNDPAMREAYLAV